MGVIELVVLLVVVSYIDISLADVNWHPCAPRTHGGRLLKRLDDWQAHYRTSLVRARAIGAKHVLAKDLSFKEHIVPAGTEVEITHMEGKKKTHIVFSYGAIWVSTHALARAL